MAYPNLKQSIWLIVVYYLISIGLVIPIAIVGYALDMKLHENGFILGIESLASVFLVLRYGLRKAELQ